MRKNHLSFYKMRLLFAAICMFGITSLSSVMASCTESDSSEMTNNKEDETSSTMKDLGAMSPEKALEYMKTTDNLVIVDVASRTNYARKHFEGAVNIPIEDLSSDEEKELYLKLPKDRPVILHCRLGMIVPGAYRTLKQLRPDIPEISYIAGRPPFDEYNEWYDAHKDNGSMEGERFLGGLAPADALEYMKATPGLYIIDVREDEWYEGYTQFEGNVHIPRSQLPSRYTEIPTDRPVILNCGAGVQAPRAYEFLREKNADIKQLSYIAGTPLFSAYNNWLKEQKK